MKLYVEADLRYTEDKERVTMALKNLFDLDDIRVEQGTRYMKIIGFSEKIISLKRFREKIWQQKILDTARGVFLRGVSGNTISFLLHKQAAYAGKVSFVEDEKESSLGSIRVVIETTNPQEIIDWIAPRTSQGKPLWIKEMPENV
ncbi:MAG: hypothetical protein LM586_03085 [Desulfurococcales archaeon]|jgi:predicted RNA binding protein with dsRBD fold (UPF0201 family)|nr:hypothetical protein [Desulfurococcales archaeon]MCI4457739.1 hypothetical protein [Desulfurococcaceae archaeon]